MVDKLKDWSATAASNNSAAPDGWPEGMAPSDVNNSARQGMASVREWYEDAEWINLGHAPSAYTSTTITISGDVTGKYVAGRKIRLDESNSKVAKVESSSYSAPNTTVTVSGYTVAALPTSVELHIVSDEDYLPIIPPTVPNGYLYGCEIANNSTDSEHDIDIAAGTAKDSTDTYTFTVSAITKQIDAGWASGTGNGGFPSNGVSGLSLSADTWYRVFIIGKTDGTVDAGFDTNDDASVLLNSDNAGGSGYTLYRRIGWVLTDSSSNIKEFRQDGNNFYWAVAYEAASYTASATSSNLTVGAPPSSVWRGLFHFTVSAGATRFFLCRPVGATDTAPASNIFTGRIEGVGSVGEEDGFYVEMPTDSSSQVAARVNNASSLTCNAVMSFGWIDKRAS